MNRMILVLGGGISGLVTAYELSKKGFNILLLEKEKSLGGLASSFEKDGVFFPLTYHHIMKCDAAWQKMCKELGMKIRWKKVKIGFYINGKIHPLSGALDLLRFEPLKFRNRIRMGIFGLKVMLKRRWDDHNRLNAKDWLIKNVGNETYKKIFLPLLKSKFGNDCENVAAGWLGYRLSKRESKGEFGWPEGGLKEFVSRIERGIEKNRGKIIKGAEVKKIIFEDGRIKKVLFSSKGKTKELKPEIVVNTIPAPVFMSLGNVPRILGEKMRRIKYKSAISCVIGLKEKLSDYYWINMVDGKDEFGTIFDHSKINDDANGSIIYLPKYLDASEKIWKADKNEIFELFGSEIEKIFPGIRRKIKWREVFKLKYAKAVYKVGFDREKLSIVSPVKNLFFSSMDLFPKMRNIGFAVYNAKKAAEIIEREVTKEN